MYRIGGVLCVLQLGFGHDNITPKVLKKLYQGLIASFLHITNLSLSTGIVPDALKTAKVALGI